MDDGITSRWWSREDLLLLILLGALFFLPGLGQVALFDRDEPRFATAAREMVRSGDYIVPRFNGNLRPDKPPLVYWLMSVSYRAVGGFNELGARLPSAILSTGTLLVIYFMVGSRFGRVTGITAAMMVGSCALFVVESRMATADATMLFFITLCMACAWQAWDAGNVGQGGVAEGHLPRTDYLVDRGRGALELAERRRVRRMPFGLAMLFWVSLAGGALTKGVPLLFVLVPMVVLSLTTGTLPAQLRRWRSHFHLTGTRVGIATGVALLVATLATGVLRVPWLDDSRGGIAILGALVVAMVLTPGLPGVLMRCITGGNWGWWRGLRPMVGVPLLIALVAWWVILAGERTNWELINQMVGVHFLARTTGFAAKLRKLVGVSVVDIEKPGGNDAMASYAKPPGFYLALVWATFWPWSVLIVPAAFHAVRRVLGRTAIAIDPRPYQFLLAWIVPMWIGLELSRGKLLHYPLPLYVPLAILCADALVQGWHRLTDVFASPWFGMARWGMLAIWLGMAAGGLVAANIFLEPELFWRCVPIVGAIAAAGVAGAIAWGRPTWPMVTVMGWGVVLFLANTLLLPEMPSLQLGKLAGQQMAQMKKDDPGLRLAAQGFEQPTLVFYAGQQIEMPYIDKDGKHVSLLDTIPFLPRKVAKPGERFLLAVDDERLEYLRQRGDRYWLVGKATGVAVVKGKKATSSVYLILNAPDSKPATASSPATTRAIGR